MTYAKIVVNDLKKTVLEREASRKNTILQTVGKFHSPLSSLHITPENMLSYIDMAIPQKKLLIDEYSFYILDLSQNQETEYNTLVFQKEGVPLKTVEKTSKVMDRFFSHSKVTYTSMQFLGKILGIHQKCPYVLGREIFAPDKGTSKNEANWIAFHHVRKVSAIDDQSLLSIYPYHELTIELNVKSVYRMLDRVSLIVETQKKIMKESIRLLEQKNNSSPVENVVQKHYRNSSIPEIPSLFSLHNQLVYVQALQMLGKVFGEDDPYLDDIREAFPLLNDMEGEI